LTKIKAGQLPDILDESLQEIFKPETRVSNPNLVRNKFQSIVGQLEVIRNHFYLVSEDGVPTQISQDMVESLIQISRILRIDNPFENVPISF